VHDVIIMQLDTATKMIKKINLFTIHESKSKLNQNQSRKRGRYSPNRATIIQLIIYKKNGAFNLSEPGCSRKNNKEGLCYSEINRFACKASKLEFTFKFSVFDRPSQLTLSPEFLEFDDNGKISSIPTKF